jgi:hypothetical protein
MSIHDQTAAAIDANQPGYAQMVRGGNGLDIVSWHERSFTETMYSGWDMRDARCAFIDAWAKGKARVTAGTFSSDQILHRAEQWEHGSGPHIDRGFKDPAFAQRIRALVASARQEIAASCADPGRRPGAAGRSPDCPPVS